MIPPQMSPPTILFFEQQQKQTNKKIKPTYYHLTIHIITDSQFVLLHPVHSFT